MKLCKDCKHYRRGPYGIVQECRAVVLREPRIDPVDGDELQGLYEECFHTRGIRGRCGPDAKFFEPLPPKRWWEFWK